MDRNKDLDKVDFASLQAHIDSLDTQELGMVIGIYLGREQVYGFCDGYANLEYDHKLSNQSVFHLASVSKQFTAYCIYLLEERKILDRSDKLIDYLTDMPEAFGQVSIEDLIYHTSGIADYLTILDWGDRSCDEYFNIREIMDIICKSKLQFEPNHHFQYSNSNYFLLGQVIEKITGQTLGAFARDHIFTPLKMSSTFYREEGYSLVKN